MRLLFLPTYFTPERTASSHLTNDRCEAFAGAGFDMEVYAPCPTRGISREEREAYKKRLRREVLYGGRMRVYRFSLWREGKNPVSRALRYVVACVKHFYYGCRAKDADVLFVASTPPIQGAMAALVKKVTGVPVVYNLQDIFPDSLVGTGLAKKGGLLWRIGRRIEDFTYRNADKIIVISEDFKRNIMAKGVPEDKIEVIYNWVDETAVVPVAKDENPLFEELGVNRELFHVVYAGNLGHAQNVQVLLDCADLLKGERDIEFLIFGTGGLKEEYEAYAKEKGLDNVRFFPLQPTEKVSQVYSMADVALVSCKKGLGGSAMPSKTWSILSAGTPVLCSFDRGGDLQRIVEENHLGLFAEAGDERALADNVMKFFRDRDMCREYGRNGRKYIEANLTKEAGTSKYVSVLRQFEKGM